MQPDAPLTRRQQEILHSIVRAYVETGEPVGSQAVSRLRGGALSPATIRNVMAVLADEGYLAQPHTSAGRVPTEKAFRHYVGSLTAGRIPPPEAERVRSALSGAHTVEERVERSSHMLTELTHHVGIVAAIPAGSQELEQIELVPLSEGRVLMILVTRDQMVRNRVVSLDEPVAPAELASIRNYVNRNFAGWSLGAARRELLRRIAEERALYDQMMRRIAALYQRGLLEADLSPEVHMEGAFNLLDLDLHLTHETMRQLLRALEEKERLLELLDRFLEDRSGALTVRVGLASVHPAMQDLALIGIVVRLPNGMPAKLAVLGPMRMRYERAMGAVLHTSRALQRLHL
jgi:heat-inducible transcriptional repressor